jgi:long-chain acyl-CoA synthetase
MEDESKVSGRLGYEDLITSSPEAVDDCARDEQLACIFYTGGITGKPKGVLLSHKNLVVNFLAANSTAPNRLGGVFLHSLPLFHLAAASNMSALHSWAHVM